MTNNLTPPNRGFPVVAGVTPSHRIVGLYVGTTGNATIIFEDGSTADYVGIPAGAFLPIECIGVVAGATAGAFIGHYHKVQQ